MTHGRDRQWIYGKSPVRPPIHRCGEPKMCAQCKRDAEAAAMIDREQIRKELHEHFRQERQQFQADHDRQMAKVIAANEKLKADIKRLAELVDM